MSVTQTSMTAYWSLGKVTMGRQHQQVFEAIDTLQPCTDRQIEDYTGLRISSITARRNSLAKKKLITIDHIAVSPTGRKAIFWKVAEPNLPSYREFKAGRREAQ